MSLGTSAHDKFLVQEAVVDREKVTGLNDEVRKGWRQEAEKGLLATWIHPLKVA